MLDYFTALEITGTEHTQDLYKMYCYLLQERPRIIPAVESEGYRGGSSAAPKRNADKDSLTQGEVQFLVKAIEKNLKDAAYEKEFWKEEAQMLYDLCDPEYPDSGGRYFKIYNRSKDNYRKYSQQYNRLSAIQRKLKKMRKNKP